jgi:hypothetical protein
MAPPEGGKGEKHEPRGNGLPKDELRWKTWLRLISSTFIRTLEPLLINRFLSAKSITLQILSLSINAGKKINVCGRTGRQEEVFTYGTVLNGTKSWFSGKTTLLLTILWILELQSDKIELDDVDIGRVGLDLNTTAELHHRVSTCSASVKRDLTIQIQSRCIAIRRHAHWIVGKKVILKTFLKGASSLTCCDMLKLNPLLS